MTVLPWPIANKQQNLEYINMSMSNLVENTVDFIWEFWVALDVFSSTKAPY